MQYEKIIYHNYISVTGKLMNDPQTHDKGRVSVFFHVNGTYDKATKREKGHLRCVVAAFGKTGEFLAKCSKGDTVNFQGRLNGYQPGKDQKWDLSILADRVGMICRMKGYSEYIDEDGSAQSGAQNTETPTPRDPGEEESYNEGTDEAPF